MTTSELDPRKVEEIADKAIGYLSGAGVAALVYLGDRLGLYSALRESGPSTSTGLASRARLHEGWVREWLHGQASAGLVRYAGDGRFELTGEQAAVLEDEGNPAFVGGGFDTRLSSPSAVGEALRVFPHRPGRSLQRTWCGPCRGREPIQQPLDAREPRSRYSSRFGRRASQARRAGEGCRRRLRLGQSPLGNGEGIPALRVPRLRQFRTGHSLR